MSKVTIRFPFLGSANSWAERLNRFREGIITEEDAVVLKSRTTTDQHLVPEALHIFYTNLEVSEHNEKLLNTLNSPLVVIPAKNSGPSRQKGFQPLISKDGRIGNTQFLNVLNIKIGARCALTWNLSTIDGLVNGATGTILAIEFNKMSAEKKVEAIIISFDDENVGKNQRDKHRRLSKKYEDMNGTPIYRLNHEYNLTSRRGFQQAATANLEQFPIRINYASTAHKIQGQTIKAGCKVVIHWNKNMHQQKGMSYVMLGRTQVLDDIFIVGEVDFNGIQCSTAALEESKRLLSIFQANQNKDKDFGTENWMISYLNVRSLKGHIQDILKDNWIMSSDVMNFGETWLEESEAVEIDGLQASYVNSGKGKGLASYSRMALMSQPVEFKSNTFSAISISTQHFDILSMYVSQNQNLKDLCEEIQYCIQENQPMVILGDMNMGENSNNYFQKFLRSKGFKQMIVEPTFDGGSIIDHIYVNEELQKVGCSVDRKSVYYSDHDIISLFVRKDRKSQESH